MKPDRYDVEKCEEFLEFLRILDWLRAHPEYDDATNDEAYAAFLEWDKQQTN